MRRCKIPLSCLLLSAFLLVFPLLSLRSSNLQAPSAFFLNSELLAARSKKEKQKTYEPFCLVTLAKSGSHLILKAITEITGLKSVWVSSGDARASNLYLERKYPWTHFCISPLLQSHLRNRKVIVMVRDLRDLCISATHALNDDIVLWGKSPSICKPNFRHLSFADQLRCVISEECQMQPEDQALIWNFSNSFPQAVAFAQDPNLLVCRYENLVGPKGGGTIEAQYSEIRKIALYLGISLTDRKVEQIASTIYGDSLTYRNGMIEEWKKTFTPVHKELFKKKFSQYLIGLGYEENDQW